MEVSVVGTIGGVDVGKELTRRLMGVVGPEYAPLDESILRMRYVPGEGEIVTEEEFVQRGVELVELARVSFRLLGELIDWKFRVERADSEETKRAMIQRYCVCWGMSQSSLWKAWVLVARFPQLQLPEDTSQTLAYEIISGCQTEEEAERVINLALNEGWSVSDVREIKMLRGMGYLEDWRRLRMVCDKTGLVTVHDGTQQERCGKLDLEEIGLAGAGATLLKMRGRV